MEMPAGINQTSIGREEFFQLTGDVPRDTGVVRHRIIEIDATDIQMIALRNYMRAKGIHGLIHKPEETNDGNGKSD